jgi:hypothetical protein
MTDSQQEKRDRKVITDLESNIKINFGRKCRDHEQECVICEIYKALNTIQRIYGYKETK